jgi:hypothetical protein
MGSSMVGEMTLSERPDGPWRRAVHLGYEDGPVPVAAVLPLVRALYRTPEGGSGCCLHIVLDDFNVEDSHVEFCIGYARSEGHADCEALSRVLRRMTAGQRWKLAKLA